MHVRNQPINLFFFPPLLFFSFHPAGSRALAWAEVMGKRLTSAAAGMAAEPPYSFWVAAGSQLGFATAKLPRSLGVNWGGAAGAERWLLLARLLPCVPLGVVFELLRLCCSGVARPVTAVLRRFAAARAGKCGSNRKADISLMVSISTALSAVIGAGAARKNVYNAERAKKGWKIPYSKLQQNLIWLLPPHPMRYLLLIIINSV